MFMYEKKLQYPVKIDKPNPRLASIIISQYGGPDGELGASLRYLSQRYSMPFDEPFSTTYNQIISSGKGCHFSFSSAKSKLILIFSCFDTNLHSNFFPY